MHAWLSFFLQWLLPFQCLWVFPLIAKSGRLRTPGLWTPTWTASVQSRPHQGWDPWSPSSSHVPSSSPGQAVKASRSSGLDAAKNGGDSHPHPQKTPLLGISAHSSWCRSSCESVSSALKEVCSCIWAHLGWVDGTVKTLSTHSPLPRLNQNLHVPLICLSRKTIKNYSSALTCIIPLLLVHISSACKLINLCRAKSLKTKGSLRFGLAIPFAPPRVKSRTRPSQKFHETNEKPQTQTPEQLFRVSTWSVAHEMKHVLLSGLCGAARYHFESRPAGFFISIQWFFSLI